MCNRGTTKVAVLVLAIAALPASQAHADRFARDRLAWLPADTHSVVGTRPTGVPMLNFIENTMGGHRPPCWSEQMASLIDTFQLWGEPGDSTAVLLYGRIDRATMEPCILEVLAALGKALPPLATAPSLNRQGAITEVKSGADFRAFAGWGDGVVIWHGKRARVEQLLAATRGPPGSHARLLAVVERAVVGPKHMWAVSIDDLTSHFLGVPSRAAMMTVPPRGSPGGPRATLLFDSPAQAGRAALALKRAARSRLRRSALG
jgi:hypothetical protein